MSSDDRNTAIVVTIVLLVCTVSLILIGSFIWQLIAPGVQNVANWAGLTVRKSSISYNFQVPAPGSRLQFPLGNPLPSNYTHNFAVAEAGRLEYDPSFVGERDFTLSSAAGLQPAHETTQTVYTLGIPFLGALIPVISGRPLDALDEGSFLVSGSFLPSRGEVVIYCYRALRLPTDPRSCWRLDELRIGDEILLRSGTRTINYRISSLAITNLEEAVSPPRSGDKLLRLVTTHPLETRDRYLVITAEL